MKKLLLLAVIALVGTSNSASAWGRLGHDAIAYIAETHLTPKAKKNIAKYLEHPITYYSTWMDEYRDTEGYKETSNWHTAAVDKELQYKQKGDKFDVIQALEQAANELKDYKNISDSLVVIDLKMLIHFTGDMHCPSHVKYSDIKTSFKVKRGGTEYKYHNIWDERVLEFSHEWTYMDYKHQLDTFSKKEQDEIAKGTFREWFHENAIYCRQIYDMAHEGDEIGKPFLNPAHPIAEHQIVIAGYRLARILNELFG